MVEASGTWAAARGRYAENIMASSASSEIHELIGSEPPQQAEQVLALMELEIAGKNWEMLCAVQNIFLGLVTLVSPRPSGESGARCRIKEVWDDDK